MVVGVTWGTWGAVGPAPKVPWVPSQAVGLPLSLASFHAVISPLAFTKALQLSPQNVPFEFERTPGMTEEQTWVVAQACCQPWGSAATGLPSDPEPPTADWPLHSSPCSCL